MQQNTAKENAEASKEQEAVNLSPRLTCEYCGKSRGNHRDHSACSRVLKTQGAKKERHAHTKFDAAKLERQLAYFLEDRGETPPYLETALDYRTLERLKNGG